MTREQAFQIADLVRVNKVKDVQEAAEKLLPCIMVRNGYVPMIDINRFNAICKQEGWDATT